MLPLLDVRDAQSTQSWITVPVAAAAAAAAASKWFRAFFRPHSRALHIPPPPPPDAALPATLDLRKQTERENISAAELDAVERADILAGGGHLLRNVLHFSLLRRLTSLVLTGQRIDAPDLDLPLRLEFLDLSGNTFRAIPAVVAKLAHLAVLRMENNQLREVDALDALPIDNSRLRELHLANNPQLARVDLSALSGPTLVYVDLQGATRNVELINVASPRPGQRAVFVDPSPKIRWVFRADRGGQLGADTEENGSPSFSVSSAHHRAPGTARGRSRENTEESGASSFSVSVPGTESPATGPGCAAVRAAYVADRSRREMDAFLLATNLARRLRSPPFQLDNHARRYLDRARTLCAFDALFPSVEAVLTRQEQRVHWDHFAAFVRFCYYNECFLDWSAVRGDGKSTDDDIFVASRYVLDLRRIFPLPNALHATLAEVHDNDALFQARVLEHFSNFALLEVERARTERDAELRKTQEHTHRMLRDEAAAPGATRRQIRALVAFENTMLPPPPPPPA